MDKIQNTQRGGGFPCLKLIALGIVILLAVLIKWHSDGSENSSGGTSAGVPAVEQSQSEETDAPQEQSRQQGLIYTFRNERLRDSHFEKHGIEMGFADARTYEAAACAVVMNPQALHKKEAEDGDDVYYVESTNDFVIISTDGYIRTYFRPNAGIDYYNRQ